MVAATAAARSSSLCPTLRHSFCALALAPNLLILTSTRVSFGFAPISIKSISESLTSWATLASSIVSLLGLLQSQTRVAEFGALCVFASSIALIYAHTARAVVKSARVQIEGRSIDSLNLANLRRRVNHSLFVQEVSRSVEIRGGDLLIESRYTGYCRAERESSFEFSIDSDNNVPFRELDCWAIDLLNDPNMCHRIKPLLIDSDGSSKKLRAPFLRPLRANQRFNLLLNCKLPGCLKDGIEYYTSSLSFDQPSVERQSIIFTFFGDHPEWIRVYECNSEGVSLLLKDLQPVETLPGIVRYVDITEQISAKSSRVYLFYRAARVQARAA